MTLGYNFIIIRRYGKFVNKEEIVSGTCSEDSVTLHLSSLQVFTGECIVSLA